MFGHFEGQHLYIKKLTKVPSHKMAGSWVQDIMLRSYIYTLLEALAVVSQPVISFFVTCFTLACVLPVFLYKIKSINQN